MSLNKKGFYEQILNTFFDELTCDFNDLKSMIKRIIPIFGELKTNIIEEDNDIKIEFIDKYNADIYFASDNYELSEEDMDMTSIALILYVDKIEKRIRAVDHNMDIFTPANKESVLFLTSIINKKVENIL